MDGGIGNSELMACRSNVTEGGRRGHARGKDWAEYIGAIIAVSACWVQGWIIQVTRRRLRRISNGRRLG